jgi:hypothetical protein
MSDLDWSNCLKQLGACRSYADDADETVSARVAWERCVDPHRLAWLLARLGYGRTVERVVQPVIAWLNPGSVEDCQTPEEAAELLGIAVGRSYGKPGYWEITDKLKSLFTYEQVEEAMRRVINGR